MVQAIFVSIYRGLSPACVSAADKLSLSCRIVPCKSSLDRANAGWLWLIYWVDFRDRCNLRR